MPAVGGRQRAGSRSTIAYRYWVTGAAPPGRRLASSLLLCPFGPGQVEDGRGDQSLEGYRPALGAVKAHRDVP